MADVPVVAPEVSAPPETPAEGADKALPEASKATVSKERMYTVKIDGKEEQWPESKVIERAQKGTAAEKAMDQAARYEQAFSNFVAQSKDPNKLLDLLSNPKALGYSEENKVSLMKSMLASKSPVMVQAIKQWIYDNEIEPATLTEEQRKIRELEGYKTDAEKKEADRKRGEDEAKFEADKERFFNDYRKKIWDGIIAQKLPQTELMVARITRKVQLMRKAGMEADFSQAAQMVRADLIAEYNDYLGKSTESDILNILPDGVAERLNKAYLSKLKGKDEPKIEGVSAQKKPRREKESKDNLATQLRDMERGKKIW